MHWLFFEPWFSKERSSLSCQYSCRNIRSQGSHQLPAPPLTANVRPFLVGPVRLGFTHAVSSSKPIAIRPSYVLRAMTTVIPSLKSYVNPFVRVYLDVRLVDRLTQRCPSLASTGVNPPCAASPVRMPLISHAFRLVAPCNIRSSARQRRLIGPTQRYITQHLLRCTLSGLGEVSLRGNGPFTTT